MRANARPNAGDRMADESIAVDEARRVAQHETIKSHVEHDVNKDIEQRADHVTSAEAPKLAQVAGDLRNEAIDNVTTKNREVSRGREVARGSQFVDYIFFLIYGLLTIRLVLSMVAANSSNGFVQLIGTVTEPFYGIVRGIVPSQSMGEGGYTLVVPIIIAIVSYALVHAAINAFLRMMVNRKTTV